MRRWRFFLAAIFLPLATLSLGSSASAQHHVEATYCELFVERLHYYFGSYDTRYTQLHVRTLNERLDDALVEVAFWYKAKAMVLDAPAVHLEWRKLELRSMSSDRQEWRLSLPLGSGFLPVEYEGVFYAKTASGMHYWLHPDHDESRHFRIDHALFADGRGRYLSQSRTLDVERFYSFNPDRCY